tara:strand:+ start:1011 stop:1208 length:198 start_codon:yes stop_codon:yes gene_type:complete
MSVLQALQLSLRFLTPIKNVHSFFASERYEILPKIFRATFRGEADTVFLSFIQLSHMSGTSKKKK